MIMLLSKSLEQLGKEIYCYHLGHRAVLFCTLVMNFYFSVEHVLISTIQKFLEGGGGFELIVPYITIVSQY